MEETVRTVCQSCHCECGVLVTVTDGKITRVKGDPEHPMNRGFSCMKGKAAPELVYHPDRLKYPLKRVGKRGEGKWERTSWDEALDAIAAKLTDVKNTYGPESIAAIHGTGPRRSLTISLLPYALGSPNRISVDLHICFAATIIAEHFTVGHPITMETGPDYDNAECIMVWGGNPTNSHPPRGQAVAKAKRHRNAKLIVVDPRKTTLATMADLWLQIRPGTDDALALGMLNILIERELYDKDFVSKWCVGFEQLKEAVKAFPLERVSELTWIPAEKIVQAVEMYAHTKPAALHTRVALNQNINSTQTSRAVIMLAALTGNLDVKGGNLLPNNINGYIPSMALAGVGPWLAPSNEVKNRQIGADKYPFVAGADAVFPFVPSPLAVDAIVDEKPYPLKALFCAGANPVINAQNCKRVWKALKDHLDLFVVIDFFMTPSAELADFVLPAATWLEREECCDLEYMGYVSARQKVIEPLHETRDELDILIDLIKRIPWANRKIMPWDSVSECNDWMLADSGITFEDLKKKSWIGVEPVYRKYENGGFHTPSGKVELHVPFFEQLGYSPVPDFKEPPESPFSTPELMKEYPLVLISGAREISFFASEGRQLPSLRNENPDPLLDIHPKTAQELNINDGDWIYIESPKVNGERAKLKSRVTENVDPRVVSASYGWWFPERPGPEHGCFDSNINVILSGDGPRGETCASIATRGTICRVYKA